MNEYKRVTFYIGVHDGSFENPPEHKFELILERTMPLRKADEIVKELMTTLMEITGRKGDE